MIHQIYAILILLLLSFIGSNCSTRNATKDQLADEQMRHIQQSFEADQQMQHIQQLLKTERYAEIYDNNSSSCLKEQYSKNEFTEIMHTAMERLKLVDENLAIRRYSTFEDNINAGKISVWKAYIVGIHWELDADYNQKRKEKATDNLSATVLTSWQKENGLMRLSSYQVLRTEQGNQNSYGTIFCSTQKTVTETRNGVTTTRTVIPEE